MDKELNKELKSILSSNYELKGEIERGSVDWKISYNKRADMVIMGTDFPVGSFYYHIGDTGVMLRIDKNKKIHGIAIENAKAFIKKNKEESVALALSFVVYPIRSYAIKLPLYFIFHTVKGIRGLNDMKNNIFNTITDYVAGKALYA